MDVFKAPDKLHIPLYLAEVLSDLTGHDSHFPELCFEQRIEPDRELVGIDPT